jgi:hypothetical protein
MIKRGKLCNHRLLSSSIAAIIIGSRTFLFFLLVLLGCGSVFAKNSDSDSFTKAKPESVSKLCMFKHVFSVCFQPFQLWFASAHAFLLTPGS